MGSGDTKKKNPPGYLQTIESEEIVATEGCQNDASVSKRKSQVGSKLGSRIAELPVSSIMNNSVLSQGNYNDECTSRRSLAFAGGHYDNASLASRGSFIRE